MKLSAEKLQKLEDQKLRKTNEIRRLKAQMNAKNRRNDTRKKILIGASILHFCDQKKDGWDHDKLLELLNIYLDKTADRELFGLPPEPPKTTAPFDFSLEKLTRLRQK